MLELVLILNFVIPIVYTVRTSVHGGRMRINHVVCFSFGFVYYWVIPIFFFRFVPDIDDAYYQMMRSSFQMIEREKILFYLIITLLIYLSFILGSSIRWKISLVGKLKFKGIKNKLSSQIPFVTAFALCLLCVYLNRTVLFQGYANMDGRSYAGMFSKTLLLICVATIFDWAYSSRIGIKQIMQSRWIWLWGGAALLLLSTGGRLYIVSCVVAMMCFYTVYCKDIELRKILPIAILGMGTMAIWGYLRVTADAGSVFEILLSSVYYLATEPIYTAYSLVAYLSSYDIAWINAPLSFLSGFVNLVPSVVFPQKGEWLVSYKELGYDVEAPLGALSSFTSFNIDFGILGTIAVIFFMSLLFRKLSESKNKVCRVMYSMLSAGLMFTFFRDDFSISIITYMLQCSILFPIILSVFYVNDGRRK